MREAFNFDMIPIVHDNINGINPDIGRTLTSISSNGYYGYQSTHQITRKTDFPPANNNNVDVCCDMDIQYTNAMENQDIQVAQNLLSPQVVNRKRHWNGNNELSQFKKRRQSEKEVSPRKSPADDTLEELLHKTHGSTFYHWIASEITL